MTTPLQPPPPRPTPAAPSIPIRSNKRGADSAGLRVLYIGKPLTGKTRYMLTWPGVVMLQADVESATTDAYGSEVPVIDISTAGEWNRVAPLIRSRARLQELISKRPGFEGYQVRGLALDSWTGLAEMLLSEAMQDVGDDTQRGYGKFLSSCLSAKDTLFSITRPRAKDTDPEPWFMIAAVHEKDEYQGVKGPGGKREEVLVDVLPSISGRFGKNFFSYWGSCLWTVKEVEATYDGSLVKGRKPKYYCRTDQIDAFRAGFDRFEKLPARVAGDYPTLASYWFGNGATNGQTAEESVK